MIRCNKCGFSNREQAETCVKCRTALVKENRVVNNSPVQVNKKTIQVTYEEREPWDNPGIAKVKRSFIEADSPINGNAEAVRAESKPKPEGNEKSPSISDYFSDLNNAEPIEPLQPEESRFSERSRFSGAEKTPEAEEKKLVEDGQQEAEDTKKTAEAEEKITPKVSETTPAADSPLKNTGMPTVRRVVSDRRRNGALIAISPDEEKELRTIDLEASEVMLDREMLDASNSSISRKGHANIFYLDGNWYLENMTPLKTTFVQVNQPVKLNDGDVILMGDSLFKFKQS